MRINKNKSDQSLNQKYFNDVEQAVIKLNSEGIYPSELNVSKILSRPGNLREKEVREALSKARQKLGINK